MQDVGKVIEGHRLDQCVIEHIFCFLVFAVALGISGHRNELGHRDRRRVVDGSVLCQSNPGVYAFYERTSRRGGHTVKLTSTTSVARSITNDIVLLIAQAQPAGYISDTVHPPCR
jgi:hypothetical protein